MQFNLHYLNYFPYEIFMSYLKPIFRLIILIEIYDFFRGSQNDLKHNIFNSR
jgi:hypothetical protein